MREKSPYLTTYVPAKESKKIFLCLFDYSETVENVVREMARDYFYLDSLYSINKGVVHDDLASELQADLESSGIEYKAEKKSMECVLSDGRSTTDSFMEMLLNPDEDMDYASLKETLDIILESNPHIHKSSEEVVEMLMEFGNT